jgi:saposin
MRSSSVILAFFMSVAVSTSFVIPDALVEVKTECAKGPEHWCSDLASAKTCHATKHCIQTVWERQPVKEDHDGVCDVCKEMVQEARDQLASNETQEELKEVFEGSCKLMPIKLIQLQCIKLVDDFVPELSEMLLSQMNPTMVCSVAGLCNNEWVDKLESEYNAVKKVTSSSSGHCGFCKTQKKNLEKKIQNSDSEDILNILLNICGQTSSFSDGCSSIVSKNVEKIHQTMKELISQDSFCRSTGFCNPHEITVEITPKSTPEIHSEDVECEFCEALIVHARDILVSNTTEAQFKDVMAALCKLTGTYADECLGLTSQYYDVIYAFLLKELDPRSTCALMTLCPKKIETEIIETFSFIEFQPSSVVEAMELVPAEKIADEDVETSAPKPPGCILCEFVLHQVVAELSNRTVAEDIEKALRNVCSKLPASVGKECRTLVDTYGDAILFLLVQQVDPDVVCSNLKLCPGLVSEIQLPINPFKTRTEDPNACALCEFVLTEMTSRLKDNASEASIKQALENVCQYMPASVRKDCGRLVDAYADQIIEMVLADLSPEEVCVYLKLCSPKPAAHDITLGDFLNKIKTKPPRIEAPKPGPTCVMCEFAMAELDKRILNNSTEEEMKRMIDFLCAHLPSTVADMCIDFIEQNGDAIFNMLMDQVSPKAICTELGLCSETSLNEVLPQSSVLPVKKPEPIGANNVELESWSKCEICEVVVEYLDKLLEDDTIEESLDHIIEKACKVVPSNSRDKCAAMVDTYGPYLMSQMGQLMDKTKVCQSLHLCKATAGQVQLLGGQHCLWGPAYWCASYQHADACNAVEHCQMKVWMKAQP